MANVRIERDGPITCIGIDRPHLRNAVDRATAGELADAFRAFDADASSSVAILHGLGGTFCAGADLQAVAPVTATASTPRATDRWVRRGCGSASR